MAVNVTRFIMYVCVIDSFRNPDAVQVAVDSGLNHDDHHKDGFLARLKRWFAIAFL